MRISGRPLIEYIRFLAPLFGLIAAIWALRLLTSAVGVPPGVVRLFSVTVTNSVCILLAVLLIHVRRFGGYSSVVTAVFLLVFWEQFLIIAAIAFAFFTGTGNIFTAPEYSGRTTSLLAHIIGHVTFGIGIETLLGAGMGCLLFWLIRRMVPVESGKWSGAKR